MKIVKITKKHLKEYDNLQVKAMLFDMDIDIETWELVPKTKDEQPAWLRRWKDKQYDSDYTVIDNGF